MRVNTNVKSELRSAEEIRRLKSKKANITMKNMSRDKRSKLEGRARKKKIAASGANGRLGTKAGNRKMKIILRK